MHVELIAAEIATVLENGILENVLREDISIPQTVFLFWASLSGIIKMAEKKKQYIEKIMGITKREQKAKPNYQKQLKIKLKSVFFKGKTNIMKILLLCLNAFEMMEVSPFIDVFGWARDDFNNDIKVVTCGFQENPTSTFGISIKVDILIDDVNIEDYAALAIPGGFEEYGFYEEAYHEKTLKLIRAFHQSQKPIAAVCVAAFPLAKSGILKGKKATTYHLRGGYKREELKELGVDLGDEWLVVDGHIITSSCPKTAPDVAFQLLEMLTSKEQTIQVKEAMGYELLV